MYKAEQLALFEIEPEDSVAIYGTDSIPFLVVTPTDTDAHPSPLSKREKGLHCTRLTPFE